MSAPTFRVVQPGLLTTVQDLGRYGYQRFGVPVAGAMDPFALRVGNLLLGNAEGEAALEVTIGGFTLEVLSHTVIAVTGADLGATLNGAPLPLWETVGVSPGETIGFTGPGSGARANLCVAGGVDVPRVLGSRSTYLRAQMGGYQGRALQAGDLLSTRASMGAVPAGRRLTETLIPLHGGGEITLQVILGPQDNYFTPEGIGTLLSSWYTVSEQADRMGVRLEGPAIQHKATADIVSDGIVLGAIQVPASGQPIIMMADRQTTGGYTKIATVASVDIPRLAQAQPGDRVRFQQVSVEESQAQLRAQEEMLRQLPVQLAEAERGAAYLGQLHRVAVDDQPHELLVREEEAAPSERHYQINLDGRRYQVRVREEEPSGL